MSTSVNTSIEKLKGRENFSSWKFAMKALLILDDLWDTVNNSDEKTVDATKDKKALSKIILNIDPINYCYIQDANSSYVAWTSLENIFEDSYLERKVSLLQKIARAKLQNYDSVEKYIGDIMVTSKKLCDIGFIVDSEWVGTMMLVGLPDEYKPMIKALGSSSIKITANLIETKLLQETNKDCFINKKGSQQVVTVANNKQIVGKAVGDLRAASTLSFQDQPSGPRPRDKLNKRLLKYNSDQLPTNPANTLGSTLTNPEIMRQLQSLQAQMQMMTGMQMPGGHSDQRKEDEAHESDIEIVGTTGPQVIEIPDADDSRSPSPASRRPRSRSPRSRRRQSRSRSPHRRRDRDREEAEREKQKEREKKGLPPIKKENLSVCSTTLWVGHLSKLTTPEELSDLFGSIGGVVSIIDVVGARGCAYVVMERRRDAAKALKKLNKYKLHRMEITVAWAPTKLLKEREWKDCWEMELGVSYLPWKELHTRWQMGALSLDALENGASLDEETLPPWMPPRMDTIPPMMVPAPPGIMAAMPHNITLPPGIPPGMSPGIAPGMPPGIIHPPSIPTGIPGMVGELLPGQLGMMTRPPPGMPPMTMPVAWHTPVAIDTSIPPPALVAAAVETVRTDDAMDLDTEEQDDPPTTLLAQIEKLLLKGGFNASEPPSILKILPPVNQQRQQREEKPDDDRRERDRDRRDRDRDRDKDRDKRRDDRRDERKRDDREGRDPRDRGDRDRDRRERDKERDRGRDRDRRDRDRDRSREERRYREGSSREKSPLDVEQNESKINERLWQIANMPDGKDANDSRQQQDVEDWSDIRMELPPQLPPPPSMDHANDPWGDGPPGPGGSLGPPPFGPFNSMGPSPSNRPPFEDGPPMFDRPPFNSMQFDGSRPPPFDGPRPPFDGPRPPFDGIRPPFDGPRPPFDGPRPPFNGIRPPFDGFRPPFDGHRPPFDGHRPSFGGPRPPFDGPRPPFDGPRPPFDGPRPPFDGPRPPFDGPRPPFNGPGPFDGPRPPFNGPGPFDGPRPPFNGPGPFDGPPLMAGFRPQPFKALRPLMEGFKPPTIYAPSPFEGRQPFDDPSRNRHDLRSNDMKREYDDRSRGRDDKPNDNEKPRKEKEEKPKKERQRSDRNKTSRWAATEEPQPSTDLVHRLEVAIMKIIVMEQQIKNQELIENNNKQTEEVPNDTDNIQSNEQNQLQSICSYLEDVSQECSEDSMDSKEKNNEAKNESNDNAYKNNEHDTSKNRAENYQGESQLPIDDKIIGMEHQKENEELIENQKKQTEEVPNDIDKIDSNEQNQLQSTYSYQQHETNEAYELKKDAIESNERSQESIEKNNEAEKESYENAYQNSKDDTSQNRADNNPGDEDEIFKSLPEEQNCDEDNNTTGEQNNEVNNNAANEEFSELEQSEPQLGNLPVQGGDAIDTSVANLFLPIITYEKEKIQAFRENDASPEAMNKSDDAIPESITKSDDILPQEMQTDEPKKSLEAA